MTGRIFLLAVFICTTHLCTAQSQIVSSETKIAPEKYTLVAIDTVALKYYYEFIFSNSTKKIIVISEKKSKIKDGRWQYLRLNNTYSLHLREATSVRYNTGVYIPMPNGGSIFTNDSTAYKVGNVSEMWI